MNQNLQALRHACQQLEIEYQIPHSNEGVVIVQIANKNYPFVNWSTPLNSHSQSFLCQDKEYFYQAFRSLIRMPATKAYLTPKPEQRFSSLAQHQSISEIIEDVVESFELPVVIKPNRGSWGKNVVKACNAAALKTGFEIIFDQQNKDFDYCALAQQYIDIGVEYRAVFVAGELSFAYVKSVEGAQFTDNLSPLHWHGSKAIDVDDPAVLDSLEQFSKPLFEAMDFGLVGLDIAQDHSGQFYLIEANAAPGFDHYIRDCGDAKVVDLYCKALSCLVG